MITSQVDDGLGWLVQVPWLSTFGLVSLAVAVVLFGWYLQKRAGKWENRRGRNSRSSLKKLDLSISRLESLPVTPIAQAKAKDLHVEGRLASAVGSLGGRPENACIWHNRAGANRESAVGTELVLLADETGQLGIENIAEARVIAPVETKSGGRDRVSLYLGDRVQVLGRFSPEVLGNDDNPKSKVYGFLGRDGPIQVRLLDRYSSEDTLPSNANHSTEIDQDKIIGP